MFCLSWKFERDAREFLDLIKKHAVSVLNSFKTAPQGISFFIFRRIAEKGVKRVEWKILCKSSQATIKRLVKYSYANIGETEVRTYKKKLLTISNPTKRKKLLEKIVTKSATRLTNNDNLI